MAVSLCVALLRAVNVGGRVLPMEELRATCARLGLREARTYIQSGNVVFRGEAADGARLEEALGVRVLVRTAAEMAAVAAANPFMAEAGSGSEAAAGAATRDGRQMYVTFLEAEPAGVPPEPPGGPDRFVVAGREVYLHVPGGYGRTRLNNAFFERRLRVTATTRNWATVLRLAAMAAGSA